MPECSRIDSLVTPYVDGALPQDAAQDVTRHVGDCAACRAKVAAEQGIRQLLQSRRTELGGGSAPESLKSRLASLQSRQPASVHEFRPNVAAPAVRRTWAARIRPFAVAASFLLVLGLALLYQATRGSSRVLAAELAADHVKCFGLNEMLGTHHSHEAVEAHMSSSFEWDMEVPQHGGEPLQLVGSRLCLYGEGRSAHIMFRHNGVPMSLFMLPHDQRDDQHVAALGHHLRMWSVGDRTFVLVSREPQGEVDRVASLVRSSLK